MSQMFGMFTTKFSWIVQSVVLKKIDAELFCTSHNVSKPKSIRILLVKANMAYTAL
jgi:hypothetical protein